MRIDSSILSLVDGGLMPRSHEHRDRFDIEQFGDRQAVDSEKAKERTVVTSDINGDLIENRRNRVRGLDRATVPQFPLASIPMSANRVDQVLDVRNASFELLARIVPRFGGPR